jgi:hypothetical protein
MRSIVGYGAVTAVTMSFTVGCPGCAEHETGRPPQSVAALENGLADESVGITLSAPVRRAPPQFDDADADAVRLFHDVLAPYGRWVDDSRLGLVWVPSHDALGESFSSTFVPYATHGRWTYREVQAATEHGPAPYHEYVWVSDLPWGWVTFHYGRWTYLGERGWAWVAGRRYAGAWVDWRTPSASDGIIGWGPTPPAHIWRVSPERRSRSRLIMAFDPRDAQLVPIPYAAFATPYTYVKTRDFFDADLGSKLLPAASALAVAYATAAGEAPSPAQLGFARAEVPAPPAMDRGLQQAWMLATPATASAIGAGPELASPPHLRTWVAGGPRWAIRQ